LTNKKKHHESFSLFQAILLTILGWLVGSTFENFGYSSLQQLIGIIRGLSLFALAYNVAGVSCTLLPVVLVLQDYAKRRREFQTLIEGLETLE
jgi:ABC-type Na+ efflux pump permease subunit